MRLRGGKGAPCRSIGPPAFCTPRSADNRFCRPGLRGYGSGAKLLCGVSSLFSVPRQLDKFSEEPVELYTVVAGQALPCEEAMLSDIPTVWTSTGLRVL